MATNFSTAALTADGMASNVRMLVGNGFTPDVGAYALDLVRRIARAAGGAGRMRRSGGTACRCAGATSTGSAT